MSSEHLELADWRRQVFHLYDTLRRDDRPGPMRTVAFRAAKDRLFASHPQSPIPIGERHRFRGLAYWRYDQALALRAPFVPDPDAPGTELPRSTDGTMGFRRIGTVAFSVRGEGCALSVYWIEGYAGGIFIPFRDATSGSSTYGGGRYLWDSIKGADLGTRGDELVLDFNFAYHPSCVYDPAWSCPLAPRDNWLTVPIEAGERLDRAAADEQETAA
jgi:uncharacterized protein (DUF1684 family)